MLWFRIVKITTGNSFLYLYRKLINLPFDQDLHLDPHSELLKRLSTNVLIIRGVKFNNYARICLVTISNTYSDFESSATLNSLTDNFVIFEVSILYFYFSWLCHDILWFNLDFFFKYLLRVTKLRYYDCCRDTRISYRSEFQIQCVSKVVNVYKKKHEPILFGPVYLTTLKMLTLIDNVDSTYIGRRYFLKKIACTT